MRWDHPIPEWVRYVVVAVWVIVGAWGCAKAMPTTTTDPCHGRPSSECR